MLPRKRQNQYISAARVGGVGELVRLLLRQLYCCWISIKRFERISPICISIPHSLTVQKLSCFLYMQEARSLLEARLPLPAYGCLLHMSHVFNVLDARGVVGLSERNRVFVAMRNVARDVSSRAMTSVGWERMGGLLSSQ